MTSNTLAQELQGAAVPMSELEKEYRPLLKLVEQLLGVIPNCDPLLEIWPTGFRSYNLIVPNLLNLPASLLGQGAPKDLVGLAMYAASRAAGCMYCSAHSCTFALRRGASPETLTGEYTAEEAAVARVAEGIARVPADLTKADITDLRKHLSDEDIEWVVNSVATMGFLNKFMDTMGVELEESAINDVQDLISSTGWSTGKHAWTAESMDFLDGEAEGKPLQPIANGHADEATHDYTEVPTDNLGTYLKVIRQAPGSKRLERKWTKGVAQRSGEALLQLEDEFGSSYSTLANLRHDRVVRAIATVIRDNLDPQTTTIGIGQKCLIALVYAQVVGNEALTAEAVQMAQRLAPEISHKTLTAIGRFAATDMAETTVPPGLSQVQAAVVMLTKAAAPSPSEITQLSIAIASQSLSAPQLVETVVWLSVQQLLHRLYVFYEVDEAGEY